MSKIFDSIKVSQDVKNFVDHSFAISDQILSILDKKSMSQRDLALIMGKKESEVSKWLTGMHNFTLKTIAKIEAALEEKLFYTPTQIAESKHATFVPVVVTIFNNTEDNLTYTRDQESIDEQEPSVVFNGIKVA